MMARIGFFLWLLCSCAVTQAGEGKHMGVATCASSVCHGNATDKPSASILHSEYVTWGQRDPHAGAYEILLQPASRKMAARLGIGAAHEAPECLACHTDYVPESQRGERFLLSDGVGCEACHGGAEGWLESHTADTANHQDNLSRGLVATDDAGTRAAICAGCHVGNPDKLARHDMMAAGHPRLQFELATYTQLWPKHYRIDEDYRTRKAAPDEQALWLQGQITTAQNQLALIASPLLAATSWWPELAMFDCHACHAPMNADKWVPRRDTPLPVGAVRLNDSAWLIIGAMAEVSVESLAPRWKAGIAALHQRSQQGPGPLRDQVAAQQQLLAELSDHWQTNPPTRAQWRQAARSLLGVAADGHFNDYLSAEQVVMLMALTHGGDGLSLDGLYRTLADEHRFSHRQFVEAARRIEQAIR